MLRSRKLWKSKILITIFYRCTFRLIFMELSKSRSQNFINEKPNLSNAYFLWEIDSSVSMEQTRISYWKETSWKYVSGLLKSVDEGRQVGRIWWALLNKALLSDQFKNWTTGEPVLIFYSIMRFITVSTVVDDLVFNLNISSPFSIFKNDLFLLFDVRFLAILAR